MNTSTIKSRFQTSVLACLVAFGALAPGYHAAAQSSSIQVTADIPFAFRSGSQVMPAGQYVISKLQDHTLLLRGTTDHRTAILSTFSAVNLKPSDNGKLVFHRYGSEYFLYQVWTAGESDGFQLPKSHTEKEMLRARIEPAPSTTELALNVVPVR